MMLVDADLDRPLSAPVLTGWSLLRYGGFAATPSAQVVRERLAETNPELAALDVNRCTHSVRTVR